MAWAPAATPTSTTPGRTLPAGPLYIPSSPCPTPFVTGWCPGSAPWPDEALPNTPRFDRALQILTEHILPERAPAVALIWSSEPDKSQHAAGVGSDLGNAALKEADSRFGGLLDWLDTTGRSGDMDVMVLSDHGYSTVSERVDVESQVRGAGVSDGREPGGVLVAANGGCVLFYVQQSDVDTTRRLASWLMAHPWCGALLSSDALGHIDGALPASLIGLVGPRSPELTMSFRWDPRTNAAGYPGFAYSTSGAPGLGQHGAMTRHEMRNTMIARGPALQAGNQGGVSLRQCGRGPDCAAHTWPNGKHGRSSAGGSPGERASGRRLDHRDPRGRL